jgi:hypothetical protein
VPAPLTGGQDTSGRAGGAIVNPADQSVAEFRHVRHLPCLVAAVRPVSEPSQPIHGDLGGNMPDHDALPPAVIDFSPYRRPLPFAAAAVVAGALVWQGADASRLAVVRHIGNFGQYLLRALIYRVVTGEVLGRAAGYDPTRTPRPSSCMRAGYPLGRAGQILKYVLDYRTPGDPYSSTCLTKWRIWTGYSRLSPIPAAG